MNGTVLATGGGIVSQTRDRPAAVALPDDLARTSPEEHMQRDQRRTTVRWPGSAEAMEDLRRILAAREPQYLRADHVVDTSRQGGTKLPRCTPPWRTAAAGQKASRVIGLIGKTSNPRSGKPVRASAPPHSPRTLNPGAPAT